MERFRLEFSVVSEDGGSSVKVAIPVAAESMAEAQDIWEALLDVLPAGRVGGGGLTEEEHEAYAIGENALADDEPGNTAPILALLTTPAFRNRPVGSAEELEATVAQNRFA